jgi:uncharacterized protein
MSKARRSTPRTNRERELEAIYAEIPETPDCTGACAEACGPIVMFKGEWRRVRRAFRGNPRYVEGSLRCPMLSPTGRCMVYTQRPYICRLWGTTKVLRCPQGCKPTRWLSREEAMDIYRRLAELVGPETDGPVGSVTDLWDAFAIDARIERAARVELIRQNAFNIITKGD